MRTPEQAKWDFVQQWLERAEADLHAADVLLQDKFESYESVGFHAQQAAEKFIKAFLVRHQIEFPKTHNIAHLRELVAKIDQGLSKQLEPAESLTVYGIEYRYPGDFDPLPYNQAKEAIRLAMQVRDYIRDELKSYLGDGRPK